MGGTSRSSTESGPWEGVQPYLRDVYDEGQSLYRRGAPAYYPGQTWNDFNQLQEGSMNDTLGRAQGSSSENALAGMIDGELGQPRMGMNTGAASMASSGLIPGLGTALNHSNGMDLGTARQLSDDGTGGYAADLWNKSQYNGYAQPTFGRGYGGIEDATRGGDPGQVNGSGPADEALNRAMFSRGGQVGSGPMYANRALQGNSSALSLSQANAQAGPSQRLDSSAKGGFNTGSMSLDQARGGRGPSLDVTAKSRLANLAGGNNPYLKDMANAATDSIREQFSESVMPSINATFGMGGRTGSRAHGDTVAKASEGLADTIANTTASIYGSNYQSDQNRALQAADSLGQLELGEFGANSQDDISRLGLGNDLYLGDRGIANTANTALGNLEVDEFGANTTDDITRRGMGSDLYLGSRGLSNEAARTALSDSTARSSLNVNQRASDMDRSVAAAGTAMGDNRDRYQIAQNYDLGRRGLSLEGEGMAMSDLNDRTGLGQNYDLARRGLSQEATNSGYGFQMDRNEAMSDWYNSGADRSLSAGDSLIGAGMGGIDDSIQMYNAQTQGRLGAGSMVNDLSSMQWGNLDRARAVGDEVQGLSDAMLEDDISRFNYYQNAPWQMMNRYAGIIGDNAMMSNSSSGRNTSISGALAGLL